MPRDLSRSCSRLVPPEGQVPKISDRFPRRVASETKFQPGWGPGPPLGAPALPPDPGNPWSAARLLAAAPLTLVSWAIFLHIFTCISGSQSIPPRAPPWASALEPGPAPGAWILLLAAEAIAETRPAPPGPPLVCSRPTVCTCVRARAWERVWALSGEGGTAARRPAPPRGPRPWVAACQPPARPLAGSAGTRPLRRGAEDPHGPLAICALLPGRAGFAGNGRADASGRHWPRRGLRWRGAALSGTWVVPGSRPRPRWASPAKKGEEPASASGSRCARLARSP